MASSAFEIETSEHTNQYNVLKCGGILFCDVIQASDNRIVLTVPLLELLDVEWGISNGRFINHYAALRSNSVSVKCSFVDVQSAFGNILKWVIENVQGRWSFHLAYISNNSEERLNYANYKRKRPLVISLFFSEKTDSILFRLSVVGEVVE